MSKMCTIPNCNSIIKCKGLCHKHYNSQCYHKNPNKFKQYDRSNSRRFKRLIAFCKRENIPTDLTFETWLKVIQNNKCFYCTKTLPETGSALDRKYPDVGYFVNNIVPCCTDCNKSKGDRYSHIEFKVMMQALLDFRGKHGL